MSERAWPDLVRWGWSAAWEKAWRETGAPGHVPARVTAVHRDRCLLRLPDRERWGEVTGRFRLQARGPADFPAVGDWAVAAPAGPDLAVVHGLLPRRTVLSRKAAGTAVREQVLAANVDVAFVMTAFDGDFNARRLERYALLSRQAGVEPVILLNKSDLAGADDPRLAEARAVLPDGAAHRLSARTGEGLDVVRFYLSEGRAGVFLGSSGVGKSTLLNALLGRDVQETTAVRVSDSRGRHTTTHREMFPLPEGGLVIDSPGLREVQLWADEAALPEVFSDVALLARDCRYDDCRHAAEPGCAVKAALAAGGLSPERFAAYVKLQKELAYLKRKQDPAQAANTKRRWKTIHKAARKHIQDKRRVG